MRLPPASFVIARFLGALALLVLFRWRIEGRDNLPRAGYVLIANHLNWLDTFAVLLAAHWRPPPCLVGWANVMQSPKIAWLVRNGGIGFIPVERDQRSASPTWNTTLEPMLHCLKEGSVLILFPEGTVGHNEGQLAPFHSGFAKVALASGADIVPMGLSGTRDLWFRKKIVVRIGLPIRAADGDTCMALIERGRSALQELLPEYVEPAGRKFGRRRLTRLIPSLTDFQGEP